MPYTLPKTAVGQWRLASLLGNLDPWRQSGFKTAVRFEFSSDWIGSGRGGAGKGPVPITLL